MCVITVIKRSVQLDILDYYAMVDANPDGVGLLAIGNQGVYNYSTMDADSLYDTYLSAGNNCDIALHFRLATHGKVNSKNLHPFPIGQNRYLMHNGMIDGIGNNVHSDTKQLADLLAPMTDYQVHKILLLLSANTRNKFLLCANGRFKTYGQFMKHDSMLCSNLNWQRRGTLGASLYADDLRTMDADSMDAYFYNQLYKESYDKSK